MPEWLLTDRALKLGKYAGRVIADVITAKGNVATILITEGHARKYDGGKRKGWCPAQ